QSYRGSWLTRQLAGCTPPPWRWLPRDVPSIIAASPVVARGPRPKMRLLPCDSNPTLPATCLELQARDFSHATPGSPSSSAAAPLPDRSDPISTAVAANEESAHRILALRAGSPIRLRPRISFDCIQPYQEIRAAGHPIKPGLPSFVLCELEPAREEILPWEVPELCSMPRSPRARFPRANDPDRYSTSNIASFSIRVG